MKVIYQYHMSRTHVEINWPEDDTFAHPPIRILLVGASVDQSVFCFAVLVHKNGDK